MIAFNADSYTGDNWQARFEDLLPQIERILTRAFSRCDPDKREEAVQCATVFCMVAFMRLHGRGRAHLVSASNLAWYAVKQTKSGRPAAGRINSRDLLSAYGRLRRRLQNSSSQTYVFVEHDWIEQLADGKRAPVPDQVAARLDVGAWINTLSNRSKRIAADLASGFTTAEAAARHGLSAGRISQIRRQLQASWLLFVGEPAPAN